MKHGMFTHDLTFRTRLKHERRHGCKVVYQRGRSATGLGWAFSVYVRRGKHRTELEGWAPTLHIARSYIDKHVRGFDATMREIEADVERNAQFADAARRHMYTLGDHVFKWQTEPAPRAP